ncbi:MAG: S26 family signal peptidase, partial [Bacteroidia bacterium]
MGNYIFLGLVIASFFGLSKLFAKAGIESWKGWVPFYNFYCLSKLLNKPWWWCLIMAVPGVNILMYGVYGFNVARAFNKPSNSDLLFASILPYIFFVKIGVDPTAKFVGLDRYKVEPIKFIKNWVDPIIFAVIAASIIRGYFIEAFTIPTSSLEKSLMVGDFLFVNKFAYGPKIPQTPLSFPFAHHTLPLSDTKKSYLEWIKLPYFRLPGFGHVKNNEIVVFNYPDGDTVALKMQNQSYYQIIRDIQRSEMIESRKNHAPFNEAASYRKVWEYVNSNREQFGDIVARPVDKREHYVKRCVGIAGDKFEVRNSEIFINGTKQQMPEKAQHNYFVKTKSDFITAAYLDQLDIYVTEAYRASAALNDSMPKIFIEPIFGKNSGYGAFLDNYDITPLMNTFSKNDTVVYYLNMTEQTAAKIKNDPNVYQVFKKIDRKDSYDYRIFPHNPSYAWNNDNFGPLQIPSAGMTIPIDTHNVCLYEKIMNTYDDGIHQVTKQGAQVLYDGKPITSYTFKQDYYFMMGDNRHNSADSRSWGFVPFDHVVGSPFFVWFSMKYSENNPVSGKSVLGSLTKNSQDGKFRWDRFLCYVQDGTLHSVKIPF